VGRRPVHSVVHAIARAPWVPPRSAVLAAVLGFVTLALCLDVAIRHDPISVDFHTYLAAARVGVTDGWAHIYDRAPVAQAQHALEPRIRPQRFLSPPTVALLAAPLTPLPFAAAYALWAVITFLVLALAFALCGLSTGIVRWIAAAGALSPWWVMHAVDLGQVVPLVAAGCVLAWRLSRDRHDLLAGVALVAVLLKPNTAFLVPPALLFAGRVRAFAAWAGAAIAVLLGLLLTVGAAGLARYTIELRGPLPGGADALTLHGAFGVTGVTALAVRLVVAGVVLATATRLRERPGLAVALGVVGSLVITPYLHASDLCVLAAAGWMVWEERPRLAWRAFLAAAWLAASPFLYLTVQRPHLTRWPWLEVLLLAGLVLAGWRVFTPWADLQRRAPA
jgi:Glycosyltransferase family 87